jgi:hypothetical protein
MMMMMIKDMNIKEISLIYLIKFINIVATQY